MEIFLLIVHVLVCVVLILSILMQPGRSGGLSGGAFGGMSAGASSMFGGGGAVPLLAKITAYAAIVFVLTCVGLWYASRTSDAGPKTAAQRALEQRGAMPAQSTPQPFNPAGTTDANVQQTAPADSSKK